MNLNLNRATRARIHVAILNALDVSDEPVTPEDHMKHAFAEAITFDFIEDPIILSRKIDAFVIGKLHRSGYDYATVDWSALNEDTVTVRTALKLCGIYPRPSGRTKTCWTDAPDGEPTLHITLPENLTVD